MNLSTIPPGAPFLDVLARWWLDRAGTDPLATADGLILLPTRRAARALTDAFLRVADGRPLLLPRIAALGGMDEAPLALAGALDLPPAVAPLERLAVLTRLVMALDGAFGAPGTADGAWRLARELADLLDEAHREEVDLAAVLPKAAEAAYAEHWGRTVEFLQIVTAAWPAWLRDNARSDIAARARALLETQAASWDAEPPPFPVVVAGTTGGVPAVARLMRTVALLPMGDVILPGLDLGMDAETWDKLQPGHPQTGMRDLLNRMGASRAEVNVLEPGLASARVGTLWRALLPARALATWRDPFAPETNGLLRLEPADQQEEAAAIALALRDALERPHVSAALVTPDRALALRVAAELARYGVVVDDSAGENLADTPPAAFLRLLARAVADGMPPVALLSVLKHPLAAFGLDPAACRRAARTLERDHLRGPAPPPGIAGLRLVAGAGMAGLIDRLEACLAPLLTIAAAGQATPEAALRALLEAAEAAATTPAEPGATRLWAHEEGEALATHFAALADALPHLPAQPVGILPGLLDASMEGAVVRSRRALRGREGVEHPRVAILGLLEARLQTFDLVVLGGLAEGVWPPATDPGPWMGRAMRTAAGLASPEERVGQMAHDFSMLACAAPTVILSCPRRRDGAPAVPARWLVRLDAFLAGHHTALRPHPAARWARTLDQPDGPPRPALPPRPLPPLEARPRALSVTEIETWLRDPYAIYAKHILQLRPLDPLEQSPDAANYGEIVHEALAAFIRALPHPYPEDAAPLLRREMDRALESLRLRPALAAWWKPRLHRIADWVGAAEAKLRLHGVAPIVTVEARAKWDVAGPGQPFTLSGRADRIERRADGTLAILDYKTGTVPSAKEVEQGFAPQLPLEAAMAARGVFGADFAAKAGELAYWHLTGGFEPGHATELFKRDKASIPDRVEAAVRGLVELIDAFDLPDRPYLSRPNPERAPAYANYNQLARVAEWAALEDPG